MGRRSRSSRHSGWRAGTPPGEMAHRHRPRSSWCRPAARAARQEREGPAATTRRGDPWRQRRRPATVGAQRPRPLPGAGRRSHGQVRPTAPAVIGTAAPGPGRTPDRWRWPTQPEPRRRRRRNLVGRDRRWSARDDIRLRRGRGPPPARPAPATASPAPAATAVSPPPRPRLSAALGDPCGAERHRVLRGRRGDRSVGRLPDHLGDERIRELPPTSRDPAMPSKPRRPRSALPRSRAAIVSRIRGRIIDSNSRG
jgi:hypothetical protein